MAKNDLTPAAFKAALAKGHGRALLNARATARLIDESAALDACIHNRSYDPQLEGSRAAWMMEILEAAEATERLRAPVLAAVEQTTDTWDLDQLCDFAEIYARRGSEEARLTLYWVFEYRPDPSASWLAEAQIVRLDGMHGFLRVAERRGAEIRSGDSSGDGFHLWSLAEEIPGGGRFIEALRQAAEGNPDLHAFLDSLPEYRSTLELFHPSPEEDRRARMQAISVEAVFREINGPNAARGRILFRIWGRYASDADLLRIQTSMFSESEPVQLGNYLRVLSGRALPRFDDRLIELAEHEDPDARYWALNALRKNAHQSVRAYALDRLRAGEADHQILRLLAKNYRDGDHALIEAMLKASDDADEMHGLAWALHDIFTENKSASCLHAMIFAYEHTPCSQCRAAAVKLLLQENVMPQDLLAECQFDANEDIREMARQAGPNPRRS